MSKLVIKRITNAQGKAIAWTVQRSERDVIARFKCSKEAVAFAHAEKAKMPGKTILIGETLFERDPRAYWALQARNCVRRILRIKRVDPDWRLMGCRLGQIDYERSEAQRCMRNARFA